MPRIDWPQQPDSIMQACSRHRLPVAAELQELFNAPDPPKMSAPVARAFLRCFYAARDIHRAHRDVRTGGKHSDRFAAHALSRREEVLAQRLAELSTALGGDFHKERPGSCSGQ